MTAEEENKVLLFWSGEIDESEVNDLLAENPDAAKLLAELRRQANLANPDEIQIPRPFAAIAAETVAAEPKVVRFPTYRVWAPIAAAAAILILTTIIVFKPDPQVDPTVSRRAAIDAEIAELEIAVAELEQSSRFSRRRS